MNDKWDKKVTKQVNMVKDEEYTSKFLISIKITQLNATLKLNEANVHCKFMN